MMIGINTISPTSMIDIVIEDKHFTDKHIRQWAIGNMVGIADQETALIEHLSMIITRMVLDDAFMFYTEDELTDTGYTYRELDAALRKL